MKKKRTIILILILIAFLICLLSMFFINKTNNEMSYEDIMSIVEIENKDIANEKWQISIPKISLVAPIQEDATEEVLKNNVGHFINSSKLDGNVGLARTQYNTF